MGFSAAKETSNGAVLQDRNVQRALWVLPVPELAAVLHVFAIEIMKLRRAAYGLEEALVEWHICISTVLKEHRCRRLDCDPCCWIMIDPSLTRKKRTLSVMTRSECPVVAATGGHVDDSVFVGKEGNEEWETARSISLEDVGARQLPSMRRQSGTPEQTEGLLRSSYTTRTNRTERTPGWFELER